MCHDVVDKGPFYDSNFNDLRSTLTLLCPTHFLSKTSLPADQFPLKRPFLHNHTDLNEQDHKNSLHVLGKKPRIVARRLDVQGIFRLAKYELYTC